MIFIYRYFVAPLAIVLLPFAALFNAKIREGTRMRRQRREYPEFAMRPVWIHAASGEFEYAKSVIRELKMRAPHIPVVVTYFSPTYSKQVQGFPGVDFAMPLPLDLPGPVSSFLKRVNPRCLLLARTDFWPEVLAQTRARGIPIHVFSYTQKDPSRLGYFGRIFARWRLSLVDQIHCVSLEDKKNVETLKVEAATAATGDTRYDQVLYRLTHPKTLPTALKPAKPAVIAGSTWPEDEKVLLRAMKPILQQNRAQLILVPHEPSPKHIAELKQKLEQEGLTYRLFSEETSWSDRHVLLVDQVGWLAELYAWCDLAFIGGSFRKTVHSVMEALGAGLPTFVGPLHTNNREAIEFQRIMVAQAPAVTVAKDASQLSESIMLRLKGELDRAHSELKSEFQGRLGASPKLVNSLGGILG